MSISTNYNLNSVRPPQKQRVAKWSLSRLVKTVFIGTLLLASGAFATTPDLCKQSNTQALCFGNLGIPRNQMPQVEGDVRSRYLMMKRDSGVPIRHETISAHKLTATQNQISRKIVYRMLRDNQEGGIDPCKRSVLVAHNGTDLNIIDGHHTTTACKLLNGYQEATIIEDPENQVLGELQNFPGVARHNL